MEVSQSDDHDCSSDGHQFTGVEPHLSEAEGRTASELMDVYACRECNTEQYIYYGPDLTTLDGTCCGAFAANPTEHLSPVGPTLERDWQYISRRCECAACGHEFVIEFEMFNSELVSDD